MAVSVPVPYQPHALDADVGKRVYDAFLASQSPETRRAYAYDLVALSEFVGAATPAAALAALATSHPGAGNGILLGWRTHMVEAKLTPATINRRLAAVRSALKLARMLGACTWAPEVPGLKQQKYRDTRGPGLEGTRAMLNGARTQKSAKAVRDVAIVRLTFDLALRRAEVIGLDVEDVDAAGQRAWVLRKGKTQKEARTLPPQTLTALRDWLQVRSAVAAPDETALFVRLSHHLKGRRITGRGFHHIIERLGRRVGIRTRPHGLRHASITAALDLNGGDVRAAQQHAGHANVQTTLAYDDARQDLAGKVAARVAEAL